MSYVPVDMHGGPSIYANFTPGDVASTIIGATVDAYNFGVKHKLWGDGTYIGGHKRSRKRHNNDNECTSWSITRSGTVEYEDIDDDDITDENGVRHYKSDTMEIEGPIEKYYDAFGNLASMYDADNDIERTYAGGKLVIEENYKTGYTTFFNQDGSVLYKVHDLDDEDDDDDEYDDEDCEEDEYEDDEEESDEDEEIEDESYDKKLFSSLIVNHITFMNKQGYTLTKIDMDDDDDQSAELIFDNNDTGDHRVCEVSLH